MKKLFLFVLGILFLSPKMTAREQIPFTISGDIDHMPIGHGGKLTLKNGGKLVMRTGTDFDVPVGVLADIENGEICRSNDF
ncbi:MAG TPA: hypothetical protein DCG33_02800 [Prevotellaceae bacterium]|nr:hypothetical protein [Prevotellaceae bacterium]